MRKKWFKNYSLFILCRVDRQGQITRDLTHTMYSINKETFLVLNYQWDTKENERSLNSGV